MSRTTTIALLSGLLLIATGCDKQGLHPYGQRADIVESCGEEASVYLRSTDEGTDMVILGRRTATEPVDVAERRCFMTGTVLRDSSTTLNYGDYHLDSSGSGVFRLGSVFVFVYEGHRPIIGRSGAARTDLDPFGLLPIAIEELDDGRFLIDVDGESHVYTALNDVIAAIDLEGETGIHDVYQLFNLALFFSQVRVPAFGGVGMTRYTTPTTFAGLSSGTYRVAVDSFASPTTTITYNDAVDFPGIWVEGDQITDVSTSGNGPMRGVLAFEFRHSDEGIGALYAGTVDYQDLRIENGVAASGHYTVTVFGDPDVSGEVPYTAASNVDVRNILPVEP